MGLNAQAKGIDEVYANGRLPVVLADEEAEASIEALRPVAGQPPRASVVRPDRWEEPTELPPLEPPAPALPSRLLPAGLAPWVEDVAERRQVPLEMIGAPAMVALSAVVGRSCGILPKRHDNWLVVGNLWGGVVAPPSALKSPCLNEATAPLHAIEREEREQYESGAAKREAEQFTLQSEIEGIEKQIKARFDRKEKAASDGPSLEELQAQLIESKESLADSMVSPKRLVTNDPTTEKLVEILRANPRCVLVNRDELSGFLKSLEKQGRETDRSLYLESWNGYGQFTVDRIGRGTITIDALCVSILGGIQPHRLAEHFSAAIEGDHGDDGLLARFQLLVYPELSKRWRNIDRAPDHQARERVFQIFRTLYRTSWATQGADLSQTIPAFRFDDEAQELQDAHQHKLETRLRSGELGSPAFEAHLGKYRSLMPSLALLFHLVARVSGSTSEPRISLDAAKKAAAWCDFLERHARRIYASTLQPGVQAAYALAERIERKDITDGMAVRSIYRKHWSRADTQQKVEQGLQVLADSHWIRLEEVPTAGAPREVVRINPALLKELTNG